MDYIILLKGVKEFEKEHFPLCPKDRCYVELVLERRNVWENLDLITREHVENVVIEFLRRYMVPYTWKIDREELAEALRSLNGYSELLIRKRLLDLNLNEWANTEGRKISSIIKEMYQTVKNVYAIGPTSASKILHGINPQLFMMWDDEETIRSGYGYYKGNSTDYLDFLTDCQKILRKVVESYQKKLNYDIDVAVKELGKLAYPKLKVKKPLAKLLDEYNFMKFTKNKDLPNPWVVP